MSIELLPCPFCGGKAIIRSNQDSGNAWGECTSCMGQSGGYQELDMPEHILRDHAAKEWNRRIPASEAGWRDIASAPHETNVLLAWWDDFQDRWLMEAGMASWGWRRNGVSNMSRHGQATHWMPLPSAPDRRPA